MMRHYGVNGSVQNGTGFLSGYANRNVFTIDLVDLPVSGVKQCHFGIFVGSGNDDSGQGIKVQINERSGGGAWDCEAYWSLNTTFPTNQTATLLPVTTTLSNFYGRYQIEFFNPVYVYNSQFFNFVRFNWNVVKDGITLASSTSYTNLEMNYNASNLCDDTYYFARVQDTGNADATFDNFGIGLNGNLGCLPSATPPAAPGP